MNKALEQAVRAADAESRRLDIAAAVAAEIEDGALQVAAEIFEGGRGSHNRDSVYSFKIDKLMFLSVLRGRQAIRRGEHETNKRD